MSLLSGLELVELELGGVRVQGVVEEEVEAEVRWRRSTGLGNDCAVWKQDGRSAGRTQWLAKGVRPRQQIGWPLPNQRLITNEKESLGEWKGIKHTAKVSYNEKEAALEDPLTAIIL